MKELSNSPDLCFIKFSSDLIEKYIEFNERVNLYNLIYLKEIIESIQKIDKKFKYKYDIVKIIHENGLIFVNTGQLKNIELLEFLEKDEFYQNKKNQNKKNESSLDIFNGIEIETLNEKFFNKWKKINFPKIFELIFNEFLKKIASLIKKMKYFGLLFSFYSFNNESEIKNECVSIMQNRYKEIFHSYIIEECPNFINDTCELIYLSDKKKVGIKKFLTEYLQKSLDVQTINNIYIYLTEHYNNLSSDCTKLIVKFFTTDNQNANPSSLVFLIENCHKLRGDIFSNIDKYVIRNEEEFLCPNQTSNYKFFRDLVVKKLINKTENNKLSYVMETMKIITSLQEKLKNMNINYKSLISFFESDNEKPRNMELLEGNLRDRMLYIFLEDGEISQTCFNKIKTKMKEIIIKIKFFETILKYFTVYFPNSNFKDIENLNLIVFSLKNIILNNNERKYQENYEKYLKKLDEAEKREKMGRSEFFNMIYNNMRNKYKNDIKCLEEADKTFNKLKILFKQNGIYKIDVNLLKLCLKPFKDKENNLDNEIKKLIELFGIEEFNDIEKLKEEILLISKRDYIYETASSIISFVENIGAKETKFRSTFKSVMNLLKGKQDINNIKKCKENLKSIDIDIDIKNNNYIDVLIKFKEQPKILSFLFEKTIEDCRNLQEVLSENENNFVSANDILDMEKCVAFMKDFGKLEELKKKDDKNVISLFKDKFAKNNEIYAYFKKFFINYAQIYLLQAHLDKSESLKYKLNSLLNKATFILKSSKKDSFKCTYLINNKEEEMTKENIISLRERAQLTKKITPLFKFFIETISEISNIDNILQKIFKEGYPKLIIVKIVITTKEMKNNEKDNLNIKKDYFMDEKKQNDFKEILEMLKNILKEIKMEQNEGYKDKPLIRYIYGRQFDFINHLNKKDNNISPLLKYITNDLYINKVTDFNVEKKEEIVKNNIVNWNKYLNEVLQINNLTLDKIYENTIIKKNKYQGIYVYTCEKLEKDLFQIYKYLTNNNPIAQNILLCNKETINEQITSFLYRAIKCKYNSCFIIGGIELLEFEQKFCLIDLLNYFFPKEDEKINSCLIFLFTNKSSDIYKNLEMKKYKSVLDINKKEFNNLNYELNDIEIIKSDKSGVGKTTQIKEEINKLGKKWIYFPFGGVIEREEIIERLKGLEIDNNCVLHLDLNNTDQITLMMEFLFSILITRFFGQNEDIFFSSKNIQIKVEIPNDFIDFFEKFPILTLFKIKEMKISHLSPLIVPKKLDSNIQVIANYIKAAKENKINQYDLYFPNITPEEFKENYIIWKNAKKKTFTTIKPILMPDEDCQNLIFDTIKEQIPEPTYYQIVSFINVLAIQLKKFNQSYFLSAYQLLSAKGMNGCLIRTFIVESFIKLTKHFTEGAFTELLKSQETIHKILFNQYDENNDINEAVNNLALYNHQVISFDNIDPSLIFFHEGTGQSFSIITTKNKNDKEYNDLLALKNSQEVNQKNMLKELPNYRNFTQIEFLKELKEILGINNPVEKNKKNVKNEILSLEEIAGNYVFTADNFVKMILILLRIRSNIPVIMMGETGCGKTALIRKLSEMKNNGSPDKMKILNIHAGTSDKDIIEFINKKVIPDAKEIIEKEKPEKVRCEKIGFLFEETKIWVFLDEINTCKSMGLISELMCKHTIQGKKLPSNIVFIAACNPYRQREKSKIQNIVGLDIKQAHQEKKFLNDKELDDIKKAKTSNLVYIVNPLPHSLLNFVFDFGNLKENDEKDYIKCIIKESLNKIYYKSFIPKEEKDEDEKIKKLKKLASDMIISAQNYIRSFQDKSSVSLREIKRFNIFYEFFYDYLINKKQIIEKENQIDIANEFYLKLNEYSIQIYSINLSIFVSYYLRISDKEHREGLEKKMNEIFQNFDKAFKDKNFLDLPKKEEQFIADNIKIDRGIAKNRALLENIFSIFVAINSKVPIFIVGKPGCSKSLSVQLIIKSMLGNTSDSSLFKIYPKVMVYSYQGSMSSTSKGIENVFNKARFIYTKLDKENKANNIPLIFFDEMGLAEHSPNNPLKVIHSELEYEQNKGENQVSFVGISNWALDAAKMNRGISIYIPEPDEKDNQETALIIGKSYDETLAEKYKIFFENLGKSYFLYKQEIKKKHNLDGKEDFHGNRDFYHLAKNASKNIIDKEVDSQINEFTLMNIAIRSIERNFSGIVFQDIYPNASQEFFISIFKKLYPDCRYLNSNGILERIKENIRDLDSRYLLVISKSSSSTYLISSLLNDENIEINLFIGSKFIEDLNSEEYIFKVLNKIQLYMERKNILILKNLDSVYPALYDLFNQNFTIISNKNYARLAIGSNTSTFAFVNKEFRCIINVENEKIEEEEPPFLNRFEKQILSFDYLLDNELMNLSYNIKTMLDDLITYNKNIYKGRKYDLSKLLINCNIDEIQAMIYQISKQGKNKNNIIDSILGKISLVLPQDILFNIRFNGFAQKYSIYFNKIAECYGKGEHSNFANFLKVINNNKNVVYTFSNNLENIKNIKNIENPLIGTINENNIKQINIDSLKSETEFERLLDEFYNEENHKICLIKFLPYEGDFMEYIKYFIENKENEINQKKIFIFIVYMSRLSNDNINNFEKLPIKEKNEIMKKLLKKTLSASSDYYQIFIDNLNGDNQIKLHEIIKINKPDELFKKCFDIDKELYENIIKCISLMKYKIISPYKGINKDNYVTKLTDFICNNNKLKNMMNECIAKNIQKSDEEDIISKIFQKEKLFQNNFIDILPIIERYLHKIYISKLHLLFFKAEKDQFFSSLLSNEEDKAKEDIIKNEIKNEEVISYNNKKDIIEKISKIYFEHLILDDEVIKIVQQPRANLISIFLGLNIPGIYPIFNKILKPIKDNIIKEYHKNENILRNVLEDEEIEHEKEKYFKALNEFNYSVTNLINQETLLKKIITFNKNENILLYNLLINDYFTIYINNNFKKKTIIQNKYQEKLLDNINNNKRFLNLMVNLRNNIILTYLNIHKDEEDIAKKLANVINWIESYSDEIDSIQEIFFKLNLIIPNLNEQIEIILKEKQIKYEISSRNPEYTSIINEIFFLSLDSILRVITSKEEIYDLPSQDFFELINTNKEILQDALQLEVTLNIYSQEVFSLQEIIKIIDALNEIPKTSEAKIKNIKKIIQFFALETACNNEKRQKKLKENFNNFYLFLIDILGKENNNNNCNLYKLLGSLLLNEYTKITFPSFREFLLEKILENNNFINNNSEIIKIILENTIDISPLDMLNNLNLIKEETSHLFKKINNYKSPFLDEVIMNILEVKITVYFGSIKDLGTKEKEENYNKYFKDNKNAKIENETGIIFDNSLKIFKQTIEFLDWISDLNEKKKKTEENIHLCKLYSIVYIKMYLSKLVYFIKEKSNQIGKINEIIEVIQGINNRHFGNVIKIYILKLLYAYYNNFELFKKFDFKNSGINFYKDFPSLNEGGAQLVLTYFFLPLNDDDYKKYLDGVKLFEEIKDNNYNSEPKKFSNFISENGLDIFLDITINKIIYNSALNYSDNNNHEYKKFSKFSQILFDSIEDFSDELKDLLSLFYDESNYGIKIRSAILNENKNINITLLESLLYGFKFCTNTLNNKNLIGEILYSSFFKKDGINYINNCFLPGIDVVEDYHLFYLDNVISHFSKYDDNWGCYVCSCGFYYNIEPCGFPTEGYTFECPICGKPLGYGKKKSPYRGAKNHGMELRKGHYRIFKDKNQKEEQMTMFDEIDINIPNMTLADYKMKIIEPIKNQSVCGFISITKEYFEKENKIIRNLSIIGYRLLNFINYCHLFFAYCLGFIPEQNLKLCLIKNMNIINIIETNWIKLKESLQKKNINSVQIFMNMIYKRLSRLIKKCKCFKNEIDRNNFEEEVEKLIQECINNYTTFNTKYNDENKKQLNVDNFDIKSLLAELVPITKDIYPEKEYPMLEYFNLTKYKTIEDFIKRMDKTEKYPLINQIIIENPDNYNMKYLPPFNEFINYMVDIYSFKISREEAKKKILQNEEIFKHFEFQNKFHNFIKAWDQIKDKAKKYLCRKEMPIKNLSEKDYLIYFLNDIGELGGEMYLAAACQNFISWQNAFLKPIIDANTFNGILNCYIHNIKKKIRLQEAKTRQILLIDDRFSHSKYKDFKEVIYSFSQRNIFSENGKINYSDYNSFKYDYESIEEELGKIILPGICLFEGEKELNFVTFWSEGFRGGRSQILSEFYSKYPQKSLDDKEKEIIINYINEMNKDNINGYDFKEFFASMQIIIFYLNEKGIINIDEKISNFLKNTPAYLKISDDCRHFFKKEGNILTIDKIMNIFFFIEHLCFKDLEKTLQEEYKAKIPEDIKEKIKSKLLKNKDDPNAIYTIKDLGAAIRRFISRYLAGKTEEIDINPERDLAFELTRRDLWEQNIANNDNLDDIIINHLDEFKLKVGQVYEFYILIGEEDNKLINKK